MQTTVSALKNALPKAHNYRLSVGDNTYLDVLTSGRKVWRMRFNDPDTRKPAICTLGDYAEVSLPKAQALADAAKALVRQGINPTHDRKNQLERQKQQALRKTRTFEDVARAWHQHRRDVLQRWKPEHAARVLRSLEREAFPVIGATPIAELTAPELLAVVQAVIDRGSPVTARQLVQRLKAVFRFAVVRQWAGHNEADNLSGELPVVCSRHNPYLVSADIPGFVRDLQAADCMALVTQQALFFVLYTLARTGEVRNARWDEIDEEAAVWTIPAHRMKMKQAHTVPLSAAARALLDGLRPLTGAGGYIFSVRADGQPIAQATLLKALHRLGYRHQLTVHGLRATASTFLNEAGFDAALVEVALSHRDKNSVRAAYNHAGYLERRRAMLEYWSDYLNAGSHAGQIIPFLRTG